jgi:hypothetical protein
MDERLKAAYYFLLVFITACGSMKTITEINGGFEDYTFSENNPEGWSANYFPQRDKFALLSADKSVSHSGKHSIFIEIYSAPSGTDRIYNWVRIIGNPGNGVYELTGWIRTRKAVRSPFIELQFWGNEGERMISNVSTRKLYPVTGTQGWRKVSAIFKIPERATKIIIKAAVESRENSGCKVWFDDIQLEKIKE